MRYRVKGVADIGFSVCQLRVYSEVYGIGGPGRHPSPFVAVGLRKRPRSWQSSGFGVWGKGLGLRV